IALDACIRIDREQVGHPSRPYSHLTILPYPEEYVRRDVLRDGTSVLLRPIKPEDEPLWQNMLARCSDESIRLRFRALFKRTSHEVATRYCFVDYDRDMTIVAEKYDTDHPTMMGVVNLFSDVDREAAEYAILVADDSRSNGLADLLTKFCLEIARNWELKRLYAETEIQNLPMISLFEKHGFQIHRGTSNEIILASYQLQPDDRANATGEESLFYYI
ncbi:MAG: GNAT family N-acetyltransferase, partial [Pirellulales bacterium]|nr:GNAT family N-acetyltransferase [Pirellulales bacterium]